VARDLESGVHATLAGVALGLLTPAHPVAGRDVLDELEHTLHRSAHSWSYRSLPWQKPGSTFGEARWRRRSVSN
jgi:Na+/H+ antiporter NhaA